jgi:hypothetical protein
VRGHRVFFYPFVPFLDKSMIFFLHMHLQSPKAGT